MSAVLEQLVAETDTGMAVVDGGQHILIWNPGAEKLLGWSEREAVGHDVCDLLALKGSSLRRYVGAALLGDIVQAVPVRLRHKAAGVAELLLTCRASRIGKEPRPAALLLIDRTPRHQTVSATLAQRTRELRAVLGAFPDLFFWADRDGRVLDWHAGAEVDLPRPLHRMLGHRLDELVQPEVGRRLQASIETALGGHRTVAVEFTLPHGAGIAHYEARIVPIEPDRAVAVVRNVTEMRQREEQVHRAQKMEALERLAAGLAHDFNNLLTVVGGSIYCLREELAGDEARAELLDDMGAAADKAALLLRQLLVFARHEAASPRKLDLNELVRDNVPLLARLMGEDIALAFELDAEPVWLVADPLSVEQVLYNLCTNARDAMPGGGDLTVRTELRTDGPAGAPPMAALVIADTGVGMDAETLERAFEPLFTTKQERETGLGLATVHNIVQHAGGRIEVTSTPGEGTTFTVLLPATTPGAADAPPPQQGSPP